MDQPERKVSIICKTCNGTLVKIDYASKAQEIIKTTIRGSQHLGHEVVSTELGEYAARYDIQHRNYGDDDIILE